ncbi:hypothetical protein [Geobacter sp. AOG2]|uniref:hypothetical protein n=1 Tax=Geobacter sp. AOG2 TaxID=1566347 RepID=UPI001CC76F4D|nr:hypothetical protein [Geobacter sp. AOG2]GFE61919.1 hypothetical protein AOG2_25070 [Geobacter sp. AOG2]
MTVSSTACTATFTGKGTAGPFSFGFRFLTNSDITVTKTNSQGASLVLIEDANYTLTGAAGYAGGTITLKSPLAVGETLQLVRTVSELQPIDLRNQGGYFPEIVETALDRLTMVVQQRGGGNGGSGSDSVVYPDVFYPYVLSGMALNWTAGGTELTIGAGRYYSDGRLIEFTGAIIAIQSAGYMDIYLDSAGGVVIESGDNYWKLAGYVDKLKIARIINSGVNTIQGVLDWRVTSPTPKQPVQGAFNADSVMQTFDIPATIAPWTANETIFYGNLRENNGRIYQAFTYGVTGDSAPTGMPTFWDAGLGVFVINDGGVKWAYFADSPYKGAFRYGQNNGVLWYFVFSGLLSIADYNPSRIKALLNCATKHIVVPWLSGVAVVVGSKRIANHGVYECTTAGTTGVTAPNWTGTGISDGTAVWKYLFKNPGDYPNFTGGEMIASGDLRVANGDIWKATTAVTRACGSTLPNRSTNATSGTFTDSGITWTWLRANAAGWKYYWYDTHADMSQYRNPDSNDSYAAMFVALACAYVNNTMDFAWFDATNAAGETNYATMKNLMYYNVLTQVKGYTPWTATAAVKVGDEYTANGNTYRCILSGTTGAAAPSGTIYGAIIVDGSAQWMYVNPTYTGLTKTFQNDFTGDHAIWGTSYLMDNCEVYAGLRALLAEMTARGDADTAYYTAFLAPLAVGIGLFYQTSSKEWNWSTTNLIPDEIGSEWYPSCMAGLFPELYQVPVGTTPEIYRVKWNHGWEKLDRDQPSWWGRNIDAFPTLMPAYLAVRYRGEVGKALEAVEKAKRLHLRQGFSPLGTMFIVDAAFMIAIQRLATNSAYATEQAPAILEAQQMLKLGSYYLWIDSSGNLRKKNGKPSGLTDGTII